MMDCRLGKIQYLITRQGAIKDRDSTYRTSEVITWPVSQLYESNREFRWRTIESSIALTARRPVRVL